MPSISNGGAGGGRGTPLTSAEAGAVGGIVISTCGLTSSFDTVVAVCSSRDAGAVADSPCGGVGAVVSRFEAAARSIGGPEKRER